MAPRPIIYIVDDASSIRKSLTRLLTSEGYEVESFVSGVDFLKQPPRNRPGCLVLDIKMPGLTGLQLQAALAERQQPVSIVFITGHGDIPASVRAMKAGAVDFITKPYSADVLLEAVRRAVEKDVRDLDERARVTEIERRIATLTPREAEVLALVVTGRLNKQIAGELGISEKTVKAHRARVMEKMRADSLAGLVRMSETVRLPAPH
jgi:FixJ family two-component response regulator